MNTKTFILHRFWGSNVKFSRRWKNQNLVSGLSITSSLWGRKLHEACGARIPTLIVVALAGVNYASHFKARGFRLGLHPAYALKCEAYPHMREVK